MVHAFFFYKSDQLQTIQAGFFQTFRVKKTKRRNIIILGLYVMRSTLDACVRACKNGHLIIRWSLRQSGP